MKFSPTFLFYNIEVYDPMIRNFRVWGCGQARSNFFSSFKVGHFESKCAAFRARSKYAD